MFQKKRKTVQKYFYILLYSSTMKHHIVIIIKTLIDSTKNCEVTYIARKELAKCMGGLTWGFFFQWGFIKIFIILYVYV